MDIILASLSTSISKFKANPGAALKEAGNRPFAVLVNNKPSFYVIEPELYEAISEILFDMEMEPILKKRLSRLDKAIAVKLKDL